MSKPSQTPNSPSPLSTFKFHGCNQKLRDHMTNVIMGEYDIRWIVEKHQELVVLDIGGNVGAFSWWAKQKFPKSTIHAYEPNPEAVKYFLMNTQDLEDVYLHEVLVFPTEDKTRILYQGTNNLGEASIYKNLAGQEEQKIEIPVLHPKDLPNCNFIKVDAEGCEVDILYHYLICHPAPAYISFEYHSDQDRMTLDKFLSPHYYLASAHICAPWIGTLNYIRKNTINFEGLDINEKRNQA